MKFFRSFFLALIFFYCFSSPVLAGNCLQQETKRIVDKTEVPDNSTYLCRSDKGDPIFQIQFQELDIQSASILLSKTDPNLSKQTWGTYRILKNKVLNEYDELIENFGVLDGQFLKKDGEAYIYFNGKNLPEGSQYDFYSLPQWPEFPLIKEHLQILKSDTWPKNLNMFYKEHKHYLDQTQPAEEVSISNAILWRYVSNKDILDYGKHISTYEELFKKLQFNEKFLLKRKHQESQSIKYLRYLTKFGLPENFLRVEATMLNISELLLWDIDGCEPVNIEAIGPEIRFKIAVIENLTSAKIIIDDLLGRSDLKKKLRIQPKNEITIDEPVSLLEANRELQKGEKLIILLKIVFSNDYIDGFTTFGEEQQEEAGEYEKAASIKVWKKIKALPKDKVFSFELKSTVDEEGIPKNNRTYKIVKRKDSFKPPSFPKTSSFLFGPSWSLAGLSVNNENYNLQIKNPIFISLTQGVEAGSCPILYAWNQVHNKWQRHGKILHKAQLKALKQSETITYQGWVNKFRLSEEELEASFIDEIHLEVSLKRGQTLRLLPKHSLLKKEDEQTVDLYANEYIQFDFDLPLSVKEEDILKSELIVTGYYERYSNMLVKAFLENLSAKRKLIPIAK